MINFAEWTTRSCKTFLQRWITLSPTISWDSDHMVTSFKNVQKIGGPDKTVEIDESQFGKRKHTMTYSHPHHQYLSANIQYSAQVKYCTGCLKKKARILILYMCLISSALSIFEVSVQCHLNSHIHRCISSTQPFLCDVGKLRYEQSNLRLRC